MSVQPTKYPSYYVVRWFWRNSNVYWMFEVRLQLIRLITQAVDDI